MGITEWEEAVTRGIKMYTESGTDGKILKKLYSERVFSTADSTLITSTAI